jgi:23S rRNA (guanosine2251-2'-O)-methyltransferase
MKLTMDQLNRLKPGEFKQIEKFSIVIILDNIRSMMNIGSVFRTADAFRVEKLFLCGITACPPNKEIHKTALGATESVDWEYYEDTCEAVKNLRNEGYTVYALEQTTDSVSLNDFQPDRNNRYALVFGNEVKGVSDEVLHCCDGSIEIPQFGTKHSFNVSVSAGIVIWDFFTKMKAFKNFSH